MHNTIETVIIGSGFSGLLAAIRLQKKHCNDFVLLERNSEARRNLAGQTRSRGGHSTEPLLHLLYCLPVQEDLFPKVSCSNIRTMSSNRFGLRKQARTNQTVTRLTYDESACCGAWRLHLLLRCRHQWRAGESDTPSIKGAETFKGPKFHAGQWITRHEGKRVAVIGSDVRTAQIVPAIAEKVSRPTCLDG